MIRQLVGDTAQSANLHVITSVSKLNTLYETIAGTKAPGCKIGKFYLKTVSLTVIFIQRTVRRNYALTKAALCESAANNDGANFTNFATTTTRQRGDLTFRTPLYAIGIIDHLLSVILSVRIDA